MKAAEAGKHVLCEKPIALNADQARTLIDVRNRTGVRIQEAFMVRTHPQWLKTRSLIRSGRIGSLRSIACYFSYFNADPSNIRNKLEFGGGGLMDIGCYPITISRFMFEKEPLRVLALIERDAITDTDTLTTAVLEFPDGHSTFTCSTRLAPYQCMNFVGTKGRIEVPIPFNAPNDRPMRILLDDGSDVVGGDVMRDTAHDSAVATRVGKDHREQTESFGAGSFSFVGSCGFGIASRSSGRGGSLKPEGAGERVQARAVTKLFP